MVDAADPTDGVDRGVGPGGDQYPRPALAVDGVVFGTGTVESGAVARCVLLVERGCAPFQGRFALPGGFVDYGEDPDAAVHREMAEETGLTGLPFRQFHTYGQPGRDPRGHTVSVVYVAEIADGLPALTAGDDAADARWFPVAALPPLAFDHDEILAEVLAAFP